MSQRALSGKVTSLAASVNDSVGRTGGIAVDDDASGRAVAVADRVVLSEAGKVGVAVD